MKVILTGATGMLGEGVLMACLQNSRVQQVLSISRKTCAIQHPKLKELLIADFNKLEQVAKEITGYDACFYCAGISSVGISEPDYFQITYTTTIQFAKVLLQYNPDMVFNYVTGRGTDSTEQGKVMWARVKGKTENKLLAMGFKKQYNFRPGLMMPFPGQKNSKALYRFIGFFYSKLFPNDTLNMEEIGRAMINTVDTTNKKTVLEIADIKQLALEE